MSAKRTCIVMITIAQPIIHQVEKANVQWVVLVKISLSAISYIQIRSKQNVQMVNSAESILVLLGIHQIVQNHAISANDATIQPVYVYIQRIDSSVHVELSVSNSPVHSSIHLVDQSSVNTVFNVIMPIVVVYIHLNGIHQKIVLLNSPLYKPVPSDVVNLI